MQSLFDEAIPMFQSKPTEVVGPKLFERWHCLAHPSEPEWAGRCGPTRGIESLHLDKMQGMLGGLAEVEMIPAADSQPSEFEMSDLDVFISAPPGRSLVELKGPKLANVRFRYS